MPTIYEINAQIEDIIARMFDEVDEETGEVDPQILEELTDLQMERDQKLENIGAYIKNLKGEVEAIKKELDLLKRRAEAKKNKIEYLENLLASDLQARGETKKEFARCIISFRRSEQVVITDEALIPQNLMKKKVEMTPDKVEIKNLIKVGHEVPGAELIEKQNIQIK